MFFCATHSGYRLLTVLQDMPHSPSTSRRCIASATSVVPGKPVANRIIAPNTFLYSLAKMSGSRTDALIGTVMLFFWSSKDPKKKSQSHLFLGKAFQKKKMFDMADKQYVSAEHDVISQEIKLDIMYNRAKCFAEAGKLPQAIEMGNKIVEIDINFRDIAEQVEKWQKQVDNPGEGPAPAPQGT